MSATDTTTAACHAPQLRSRPRAAANDLLIEVDGKLVPNYDATIKPFEEGDVVSGEVVRIDKDEVLVDIGYKSEGVIPSNELSIRRSVDPAEEVPLGEEVDALVLTKEDQDGRLILSKKRARFEKAWRKIEAAAESGEPVEGTVIEVVKGGLILDLGVRGFLPASLVDIRRVQNLDEFMGQTLECKVIELNRSRNNVVLSRRAVLEEERKEVREQILDRLQPGMVVEGKISNIVDFGAFVDLDGIDGLIHISELSWSHVNHPSEVLSIGETVRVKVLDIDRDRQRISLGLKQTQEDPWQRVLNEYKRRATCSRARSRRSSRSAPSSRSCPASRASSTSPSSPSITSRTRARSSRPATRSGCRSSRSTRAPPHLASVKRAESQNLPLRDLMPPELTGEVEQEAAPDEVPELDVSEEVFPETPPAGRCPPPSPRRPRAERPAGEAGIGRRGRGPEGAGARAPTVRWLNGGDRRREVGGAGCVWPPGRRDAVEDAVVHDLLEDPSVRDRLAGAVGWGGGPRRNRGQGPRGSDRLRFDRGARLARVAASPARRWACGRMAERTGARGRARGRRGAFALRDEHGGRVRRNGCRHRRRRDPGPARRAARHRVARVAE